MTTDSHSGDAVHAAAIARAPALLLSARTAGNLRPREPFIAPSRRPNRV